MQRGYFPMRRCLIWLDVLAFEQFGHDTQPTHFARNVQGGGAVALALVDDTVVDGQQCFDHAQMPVEGSGKQRGGATGLSFVDTYVSHCQEGVDDLQVPVHASSKQWCDAFVDGGFVDANGTGQQRQDIFVQPVEAVVDQGRHCSLIQVNCHPQGAG